MQPVIAEIMVVIMMVVIAVTTFKCFKSITIKGTATAGEMAEKTIKFIEENIEITIISGNNITIVNKGPKIENAVIYGDNERLNYSPKVWEEDSVVDIYVEKMIYDPYSRTKKYNKILIITPRGKKFEKEISGTKVDEIITYNESDWEQINGTWKFGYFLETV